MDIQVNKQTVICFDLDDTIYNELDYLRSAYREIAKSLTQDGEKLLFGKMLSIYRSGGNVIDYLTETYACDRANILQLYREHMPDIEPFEGIYDLFDAIKKSSGRLCLISDGRPTTQRNKLKACTEKPDENNFRIIEDTFPDCSYTYIADNFKKDFITPNKRNWNSIGLLDNGKNIHNNTYDYANNIYSPKNLITRINEIAVV